VDLQEEYYHYLLLKLNLNFHRLHLNLTHHLGQHFLQQQIQHHLPMLLLKILKHYQLDLAQQLDLVLFLQLQLLLEKKQLRM
jgi:hypothetical protein